MVGGHSSLAQTSGCCALCSPSAPAPLLKFPEPNATDLEYQPVSLPQPGADYGRILVGCKSP